MASRPDTLVGAVKGGVGDRTPRRNADARHRRECAHLLPVQQGPARPLARAVQEPRFPRLRDGLVWGAGWRVRPEHRGTGPSISGFGPAIGWPRTVFEARGRCGDPAPG